MSDEYNGWCNRETWAVALHLSNDPDLYDIARRIVKEEDERQAEWLTDHGFPNNNLGGFAADRMEEWVSTMVQECLFDHVTHGDLIPNMIQDVGSFWRVDWYAVAASFRD